MSMTLTDAAIILKLSTQRVRVLCAEDRIRGNGNQKARKLGPRVWLIPDNPRIMPPKVKADVEE